MPKLTARDIMTKDVKTISEEMTLAEAGEVLVTNGISGAPVVDNQGKLVGMLSEADLMDEKKRKAVIPRMALFGLWVVPDKLVQEAYKEGFYITVRDVMSKNVVTAEEDTPVGELVALMVEKRINRIPIVRDGKLVGIVTRHDILRAMMMSE